MKTVLVPIAPGFEEIETITVVDILRRSGARVTLAGTEEGPLKGSRGILVLPDDSLNNNLSKNIAAICPASLVVNGCGNSGEPIYHQPSLSPK